MMLMNFMQPNAFTAQIVETMRLKNYLARAVIRNDNEALAALIQSAGLKKYGHIVLTEKTNIPGYGNEAPLDRAAKMGHTQCVEMLVIYLRSLESTLSSSRVLEILCDALYLATGFHGSIQSQKLILDNLSANDLADSMFISDCVLKAALCDDHESVDLLLKVKPDADLSDVLHLRDYLKISSPQCLLALDSNNQTVPPGEDPELLDRTFYLACSSGADKFVAAVLASGYKAPAVFGKVGLPRAVLREHHMNNSKILELVWRNAEAHTKDLWRNMEDGSSRKSLLQLAMDHDDARSFKLLVNWSIGKEAGALHRDHGLYGRWLDELLTTSYHLCNLRSTNCLELFLKNTDQLSIRMMDDFLGKAFAESNYLYVRELLKFRQKLALSSFDLSQPPLSPIVLVDGNGKDQLLHHEGADLKCILEYIRIGFKINFFRTMLQQFFYLKLSMLPGPYRMHLEQVIPLAENQKLLSLFISIFYQGTCMVNNDLRKCLFEFYCEQFVNVSEREFIDKIIDRIGWEFFYQPAPLIMLCREVLRSQFKPTAHIGIEALTVPYGLKRFLNFNDIESLIIQITESEKRLTLAKYSDL